MKHNNVFLCSMLLIITISGSIFSFAFGLSDNVTSLITKGDTAIYAKNFTGAISYFDQVLKTNPNNTDALINKGVALGNLQNFTGAISYFDQVLKTNPNNTDVLNNKGAALIKESKFDEANSNFDKVLKIDPTNTIAISNKKVISNRYNPTQPYNSSRFTLFCQVEIRDKDNHLVSYIEPQIIQVPDPDFLDIMLDTWSAGKFNQSGQILTIEKSIIHKDGKDFEMFKFSNNSTFDGNSIMVSKTGYAMAGVWVIYGYHDGYQLETGDREILKFTIIRPVS
ncbi:MAG: tetratricopeptide repeat protein [Nitrosotalea sp.]